MMDEYWSAYNQASDPNRAARESADRSTLAQLQQLQGVHGLVEKSADQQRKKAARDALAGLPPGATGEQVMNTLRPFMEPKDVATMAHQTADLNARLDSTKQVALARLTHAASTAQSLHQYRMGMLTKQEDRNAEIERHNGEVEQIQRDAQALTGQRINLGIASAAFNQRNAAANTAFNTGATVAPTVNAPQPGTSPAVVPDATTPAASDLRARGQAAFDARQPRASPQGWADPNAQPAPGEVPAEDMAAFNAVRAATAAGRPLRAQGAPVPESAGPVVTAPPSSADARDLGAGAMGPVIPGAAQPTATAPVPRETPSAPVAAVAKPLTIADAPKGMTGATAQRWLFDQTKSGNMNAAGQPVGDYTKKGPDFLASLPETDREVVRKIAAYEIDPKTLSTRGGHRERVLGMVSQFDPAYDDTQYANKRRAIAQFGSGPQGNTVRSLNVAIEHIDTLGRAADALKNGDFTPGNKTYNEFAKIFGKTPPNTFEGIRDIVANEVIKGTIGNAGALADREGAASKVKASSSPAQLKELMNGWTELMGGQVKGLEQQYGGATGLKDFRDRYLTQRAKDAIALSESKAVAAGAPATGGWSVREKK